MKNSKNPNTPRWQKIDTAFLVIFFVAGILAVLIVGLILYFKPTESNNLENSADSQTNEQSTKDQADQVTDQEIEESEAANDNESTDQPSEEPPDLQPTQDPDNTSTPPDQPSTQTSNWWEYPDPIYPTTKSGDNLLVLVNKQYKLDSNYAPTDLVKVNNVNMRLTKEIYLRSILVNDLKTLGASASNAGLDLSIVSGYRSYNTQASTYQYWVSYNGGNVAAADTVSARPGHSQHQLGTAVDFSSSEVGDKIGSVFNDTVAAEWLKDNAWKYGFIIAYPEGAETVTGYAYESWHYRYIGVDNAANWKQSGLTLEEWLQGK